MKYVYPAKITKEDGAYSIAFPDIDGCFTCGDTLEEIIENAQEVLGMFLALYEDDGTIIPAASDIIKIPLKENEFATLVLCDTTDARKSTLDIAASPYATMLSKAVEFAREAHDGQKDKAGKDYFNSHIMPVAVMAQKTGYPYADIAALLHDIMEDTDTTEAQLRELFPSEVVDVLVLLTHRDEDSYEAYCGKIKTNALARVVKLCDLQSNMNLGRLPEITAEDQNRLAKYARAYLSLLTV